MRHYKYKIIEKILEIIIKIQWKILIWFATIFNKKICFWGASLFLEDFIISQNITSSAIVGIIDKNLNKSNRKIGNYSILTPNDIEKLQVDFIIFAVKNNHKKIYSEVKLYLKKSNSKVIIFPDSFKVYSIMGLINDNSYVRKQLNNIIISIAKDKVVYIFQYTFFDNQGINFFAGGAERYMLDLSKIIKSLGYTPILIQSGNGKEFEPWVQKKDDLTIIGVNTYGNNYFKIINELKEPDLAIYSGIINWQKNVKYKESILISHGITWDYPAQNVNVKEMIKFIDMADCLVSVDTNTISWFRSTYAKYIAENNIYFKYIPNYVDTTKYTPLVNKENKIRITFPRRCSEERGITIFTNIVPKLLTHFRNIEVEFVGFIHTENIKDKINNLIEAYPGRVVHRVCSQDEMAKVYQYTNISVIPTQYSEGTSLSCIEAMACGNVVIATNIGGLPNLVINDFNGKLINPNEEELYNALANLLENDELRNYLGNNAKEVAKAFSKEKWEKEWYKLLEQFF